MSMCPVDAEDYMEDLEREIESLKNDVELYRYVIKESNEWLIAGEGISLCYHMDSEPNDKQLVNYILASFKQKRV